ncbi:hypothetical protein [Microbulbifer litoralis]|uniref:hypothetical protein n=1 Tax=Microbulbifer litoralis TaxID=2933965 RepID=UPI002027C3B8|nr:hypothetical protein [Microbulbifer sp. GX H0434]
MNNKLIFIMTVSVAASGLGCASQEDLLYADLWSGRPSTSVLGNSKDIQDSGKTPRDRMLEQREIDEERKGRTLKDGFIDSLILGKDEKINF